MHDEACDAVSGPLGLFARSVAAQMRARSEILRPAIPATSDGAALFMSRRQRSLLLPYARRVAESLLICHPPTRGVHQLTRIRRYGGVTLVACLALAPAACQQARQDAVPTSASPQARTVIEEYLRKVDGRYGALALSQDGTRATYYICQSRLWKNCDDDELRDRFVSIPSAELAGRAALSRCGGGCSILYWNDRRLQ